MLEFEQMISVSLKNVMKGYIHAQLHLLNTLDIECITICIAYQITKGRKLSFVALSDSS